MMLRKACLAFAVVFLFSQLAPGQTPEPVEKIPLPRVPALQGNGGSMNGEPFLPLDEIRRMPVFYADADYLLWWFRHGPAPELLTTAPNNGLNANGFTGGILGEPGTAVLFDGHNLGFGAVSGMRAKVGMNLGQEGFWALELGGFVLQKKSVNYAITSRGDGTPLLSIPFLDAATGQPSSLDISAQDLNGNPYLAGGFSVHSDIQFWSGDFNLIAHSIRTPERSIDLLFGFRTVGLNENLTINQTVIPAVAGNVTLQYPTVGQGVNSYFSVPAGDVVRVVDSFQTRNQFYGPQIGGRFVWEFGQFSVDLTGKVAFGVTHQSATIAGVSTATAAINPVTLATQTNLSTPGGVFAAQYNSGSFSQNQFTVVPEIGINLNYAVTSWMDVRIGYGGTYWSNVARPGDQIDTTLNSKLVPTGALVRKANTTNPLGNQGFFLPSEEQGRPYFAFRESAFWAHGINAGLVIRY